MFRNAQRDPLAVPARYARRTSVGPTHRVASNPADRAGDAWADGRDRGVAEHGAYDLDPETWGHDEWAGDPHSEDHPDYHSWPEGYDGRRYNPDYDPPGAGEDVFENSMAQKYPPHVARVLDREARSFMADQEVCDDRSELLYRANRHASTLTHSWGREASQKVTEAFCGRVAAMIPNTPRVAAKPVTEFADFDDALLY